MARSGTAVLLAIGVVAAWVSSASAAGDTFVVHTATVDDRKAVFGTVESVHRTEARARIAGTLRDLRVVEGDHVAAGERIATVRDPKLDMRLAEIDADLKALDAERRLARLALDRITRLRRSGTASQAEVDRAQTRLAVVEGKIAAQRAARALVSEQQREGAVLAPTEGRVLEVRAIPGTFVMPGEAVATLATQTYVLRLHLPERHARFIKVGDAVLVGARGLGSSPETVRPGRVRLVFPELDRGRVVADVDAPGLGDFFVGERTRVWVSTGKRRTIIVPRRYLFRRFGLYYVRLKSGEEVPVQPGQRTPDGVEILSGLRDGDVLVAP